MLEGQIITRRVANETKPVVKINTDTSVTKWFFYDNIKTRCAINSSASD